MTAKGHILLAAALTQSGILFANQAYPWLISSKTALLFFCSGVFFGALFPDIDEDKSYIGNKFKIFSIVISVFIKHRTITHYLIFPLIIILTTYFLLNQRPFEQLLFYGIALGMIFHDIGDMLTTTGIRGFFWPLFPNTRIAIFPEFLRFDTFSFAEYILIGFVLIPINIYFSIQLYGILFK